MDRWNPPVADTVWSIAYNLLRVRGHRRNPGTVRTPAETATAIASLPSTQHEGRKNNIRAVLPKDLRAQLGRVAHLVERYQALSNTPA